MQLRFAMMFWVSSLAGAFSGLLAYGIRNLNGKHGISGWQWIIIVVGSFPIPLACDHVTGSNVHRGFRARHTFFVPASQKTIKLLTEEEHERYCRDLADDWSGVADTDGTYEEVYSWSEVAGAFTDAPHVLMLFVPLFFGGTTVRCRGAYLLSSIDRWVVRYMV